MSNFNFWKNEIADMPEQDEKGNWYDLETGLAFDPSVHYRTGGKTTSWAPSSDIKGYRKTAKFYGGKALKGTAKQKEWAEKLRFKVLASDDLSDEKKLELAGSLIAGHSSFWIDSRNGSPLAELDKAKLIESKVESINSEIQKILQASFSNGGDITPDQSRALDALRSEIELVEKGTG